VEQDTTPKKEKSATLGDKKTYEKVEKKEEPKQKYLQSPK
jgi:hypothetical protein